MAATPKKSSKKSSGAKKGAKAGLVFPVGRIGSLLRKGRYARRVSSAAATYLTAVLEYLVSESLELASKAVKKGSKRITPRALTLAVRHDADLGSLLSNVTLSRGGVVPNLAKALEKKNKKSGKKSKKASKA